MTSGRRVAAMILAVGTVTSTGARADPIALTAGVLDMSVNGQARGFGQLTGDRGFAWTGYAVGGFMDPLGVCLNCLPMPPGGTLALHGALALGGTLMLDGVTYTNIGAMDAPATATMQLSIGTATLPSLLSPSSETTAPFMVALTFLTGQQSHSLFGSGTARIFLGEDMGFGVPSWRVTAIHAELSSAPSAPVPEPASLSLLALGLAGLGARRCRQRKAKSRAGTGTISATLVRAGPAARETR